MRRGLCIPTLNAGPKWPELLRRLKDSTSPPDRVLVIDSGSSDDTLRAAEAMGFEVIRIKKTDFNHGGTRQMGVQVLSNCDIIVFITQDAMLATPDSISQLLHAFEDPTVGLAYGRQLPYEDAQPRSAHARLFNYPHGTEIRDLGSAKHLGLKAAFVSNSFAAYRRQALMEIGGFSSNLILGEDMVVGAKMLMAGWKLAYQADALVYHSHNYTVLEEFRRYFDTGVLHHKQAWLLEKFGNVEGEGMRFILSELRHLMEVRPQNIPVAFVANAFKYIGYRLGRMEHLLPTSVKKRLSLHTGYWKA